MATILNAYNLSGGDTTSSTFTYSGATRDLDVEIITTSIGGDSTRVTIETSADQTTWVLVPNSEIQINKGSDSYVYHITESEGAYVRAKLYVNDSRTGTMTITAAEPSAGDGIPVTGTPYKAIQYDSAGNSQASGQYTISAKVSLSAAQIKTLNSIPIDIPEYPAVAGKYWRVNTFDVWFTANTTPFTNASLVRSASGARQWDDGGVLSGGVDSITTGTDERLITPCYAANSKLQIYSPSDSVVGDGTIIYYITAQLITV